MINVAAGIIEKDGKILIAQRLRDDSFGLKWEFPGGTLLKNECEEDCIVRELMEELGIVVEVVRHFYSYSEPSIKVHYYMARYLSGEIKLVDHEQVKWINRNELLDYDLLPGDSAIARKLLNEKPKTLGLLT
jgi:8-oxo-dGTP diphosphatase